MSYFHDAFEMLKYGNVFFEAETYNKKIDIRRWERENKYEFSYKAA